MVLEAMSLPFGYGRERSLCLSGVGSHAMANDRGITLQSTGSCKLKMLVRCGCYISPRFFVNTAGNVYLKKSVKYNLKAAINETGAKPATPPKPQHLK
jgi:hypothetical protein